MMKSKEFVLIFVTNMLLLTQARPSAENDENLTETSANYTSKQIVDNKSIVIYTQLQYYDQPTLKEYQDCHENLEKCKKVCEGVENPSECVNECPVCPYLIKEKVVLQGINDTDFSPASVVPLNTTNIIRLTNQIRNIIETHQVNITNRNENIVHVHQNISRVGGKFGLGYNNTEPCCIIVRTERDCEIKQFSTATRCHHKRHRVCGKQCKSRVMMAKRTTLCEKSASYLSDEEYNEEKCHDTVQYVPYQTPRKQYTSSRHKCTSSPFWPYVLCGENGANYEKYICRRCLELPYYYILQRGIPSQCRKCFMAYSSPSIEIYPPSWYPVVRPIIIDSDYFDSNMDEGWHQDSVKCRLPDGTLSENCEDIEDIDSAPTTSDLWENFPEPHDEYFEYNNENGGGFDLEKSLRKRRQTFTRSKYSRRYR